MVEPERPQVTMY